MVCCRHLSTAVWRLSGPVLFVSCFIVLCILPSFCVVEYGGFSGLIASIGMFTFLLCAFDENISPLSSVIHHSVSRPHCARDTLWWELTNMLVYLFAFSSAGGLLVWFPGMAYSYTGGEAVITISAGVLSSFLFFCLIALWGVCQMG